MLQLQIANSNAHVASDRGIAAAILLVVVFNLQLELLSCQGGISAAEGILLLVLNFLYAVVGSVHSVHFLELCLGLHH